MTGWTVREWDSAFFGVHVAQVTPEQPTAEALAATVREADEASIDCLYLLANATDLTRIRAAEATGFAMVDIRLTLECPLDTADDALRPADGAETSPHRADAGASRAGPIRGAGVSTDRGAVSAAGLVREAQPDDVRRLMELARVSHRNTRFYVDGRFDRERCDELYAIWIERSVARDLADIVWVVDVDGAPRGYLTVKAGRDGGTIGLVAVDAECRGRGYGEALLRTALAWAADRGLPRLSVVTQGRSAAAVRFYQRPGFVTRSVEIWFHRWRRAHADGVR